MAISEIDSPSVQSHLAILQAIIGRMASNSASCKTWCITLVSAVVVVLADKNKLGSIWIAILPIVLFGILDAYYLGLERCFRDVYKTFVERLKTDEGVGDITFLIIPPLGLGARLKCIGLAFLSLSIWPFYLLLGLMLTVIQRLLL